jgi:uroporphyrinogen-III synthase
LQGQVILNTRPAHQQAELTTSLARNGAHVLAFPAIAIEALDSGPQQQRVAREIASYDILLFVSRNAVDGAFRYIDASQISAQARYGVIGLATRQALCEQVANLDSCLLAGKPYNSEGLLKAAALQQVAGKRIIIFRGQEGRNLLGEELAARGARVDYCEVYRRVLPSTTAEDFNQLVAAGFPSLAVLTSEAGMLNLFQLVDENAAARLRQTPWLLISERMRESALKLGHNASIIIARSASDEGILQTICDWADQR